MKKKTIFQNQSQEILTLFEMAQDRSKVMCIPIDYAKKDHVAMFCNGNGRIIRKPFSIKNSPEGKDYLIGQVKKSCRHHGIKPQHVFYGGEDCGAYADNWDNLGGFPNPEKGWLQPEVFYQFAILKR